MNVLSLIKPILAISVVITCFFLSCDKDYHSVGVDLLTKTSLKTSSFRAPVYAYQKKLIYFLQEEDYNILLWGVGLQVLEQINMLLIILTDF